jgi:hypothetical protein
LLAWASTLVEPLGPEASCFRLTQDLVTPKFKEHPQIRG